MRAKRLGLLLAAAVLAGAAGRSAEATQVGTRAVVEIVEAPGAGFR